LVGEKLQFKIQQILPLVHPGAGFY